MENQNSNTEENKVQRIRGITEERNQERAEKENESVQSSKRKGRKGVSHVAQSMGDSSSTDAQEQFRIVINREANDHLEGTVAKVCRGFEAGAVTRTDLANYIFCNLSKFLSDADYKALRALHFDEKKVLSSIIKSEDELPEEIRKALRDYYGLAEPNRKRSLRTTSELSTEKSVDNSTAG